MNDVIYFTFLAMKSWEQTLYIHYILALGYLSNQTEYFAFALTGPPETAEIFHQDRYIIYGQYDIVSISTYDIFFPFCFRNLISYQIDDEKCGYNGETSQHYYAYQGFHVLKSCRFSLEFE